MNELLKSTIRIRLVNNIEAMFKDEALTTALDPFWYSNEYAIKMANAAIEVLDAQKDLYDCLLKEGQL